MDGDGTYPGLGRPCLEGPVEVAGVKGQTVAGGKDVTGRDPEGAGGVLQRCLGLVLQTECGEADGGQGQDGVGGLGLGLA